MVANIAVSGFSPLDRVVRFKELMIMMVEVDLQAITGEGVLLPRFTVEVTGELLMKIGRLIALQKGMMPDNAVDIFPVAMKFVTGET